MDALKIGIVAAALSFGAATAQADEVRLGDTELDAVTAGALLLPGLSGGDFPSFAGGLPAFPGLPEIPELPEDTPEIPSELLNFETLIGILFSQLPDDLPDGFPSL